jgi:hypothetical protein
MTDFLESSVLGSSEDAESCPRRKLNTPTARGPLCGVEGLTEAEGDGHATQIGNQDGHTLQPGADGIQISTPIVFA